MNDASASASDAFTSRVVDAYDLYYTGVPGDVAFYVEEARRAGSPVLELGCGTGRIALPIAEAGIDVVGLDRERTILDAARRKAERLPPDARERISFAEGDMRDFALGRTFRAVFIAYNTFLHLLTPEDQTRTLACIRDHLDAGGRLTMNFLDPRPDMLATRDGRLESARGFVNPATMNPVRVSVSSRVDPSRQILSQDVIFEELNAAGVVVEKSCRTLTLRYSHRFETEHLLRSCGFEIEALYRDCFQTPFIAGQEQVWIARRT